MLRKLLGLSEPNPVEIPMSLLIRIYSMCYVLNAGQWFANGTKPFGRLGFSSYPKAENTVMHFTKAL